jgi:hypothetical protein
VFTVISLALSLAESERGTAIASGPTFVDTADDYAALLGQSGWCLQERAKLTAEFLRSRRIELEGMPVRADALADVVGSGAP